MTGRSLIDRNTVTVANGTNTGGCPRRNGKGEHLAAVLPTNTKNGVAVFFFSFLRERNMVAQK
jgi:hypothetical protein